MPVAGPFHFDGRTGVSAQPVQLIENGDLQFRQHRSTFPSYRQMGRTDRPWVEIAGSGIRRGIERRIRNRSAWSALVAGLHKAQLVHITSCADTQDCTDRLKPSIE